MTNKTGEEKSRIVFFCLGKIILFWKTLTCPAKVCSHKRKSLRPNFALNERWDQSLCAPIVTPNPDPTTSIRAESKCNRMLGIAITLKQN